MPKDARLDIVLFGATGFTGWICAKYISKVAPKSLQWAIAGRSQDKLNDKLKELRKEFPDRALPETIVAGLDEVSAVKLASSAKVVITTVGPYCRYGSGLVKACAEAGTHYVDCTGEHIWVLEMVTKYHETANQTGALIVPQSAFESAPADLLSYKIASTIRKKYNSETKDVTFALHNLNGGASGGTIETFLSVVEIFGLAKLARSSQPLALSPINRPYSAPSHLPVFSHPTLGILTPWLQHTPDRGIVMRSWGLTKQYKPEKTWGDNFSFTEYKRCKNFFEGIATWITITFLSVGVIFSPFRWIARKFVTQPGSGPDQNFDLSKRGNLEWRAVGVVDSEEQGKKGKKVLGRFWFDNGEAYAITALMIAEAAFAILDLKNGKGVDDECLANIIGGGVLTPTCLGETYIERLDHAGVKIEAREL
ncbi:hypothetical protein H072_8032 [Dactylellina haptotyla CBS 200.50]|uniref:Saccharopine dehydrogenase NADP binding domain-containing protein n=1 Tax=Dactylellina haptotyla (strain CBS 200.50) TaxID=1284197 RepID=S8A5S7_DACHA|nr:hypothetical protein H072_8032 [Dactylellina haptotyla CBS 200.50]